MSKLIIVCGLPGSGKTTLARKLSKELNIICLHKDSLKESLAEALDVPCNNIEEEPKGWSGFSKNAFVSSRRTSKKRG